MKAEKYLERSIEALRNSPFPSGPDRQTADATLAALAKASGQAYETNTKTIKKRTSIMHSGIKKFAIAAGFLVAIALGYLLFEKGAQPAWALEQTIAASHSVKWLHIKAFVPKQNEPHEIWVECDDLGNAKRVRDDAPVWESPDDGAKQVVWADGKADVWLKKKNMFVTVKEQSVNEKIQKLFRDTDPRFAVENLSKEQLDGTVEVNVARPTDAAGPITVIATWTPQSSRPNTRLILYIDPATKLVSAVEKFENNSGEYELKQRLEYYEYNVPIADEIFTIQGMPADVMRIDQTAQQVGLAKGDMSQEEIAGEVVKQFFEALIADDYDKAGRLFEGIPGDRLKRAMGGNRITHIISISKAQSSTLVAGYKVVCKMEAENNGKKIEIPYGIFVHQVNGQPERWSVCGGF